MKYYSILVYAKCLCIHHVMSVNTHLPPSKGQSFNTISDTNVSSQKYTVKLGVG